MLYSSLPQHIHIFLTLLAACDLFMSVYSLPMISSVLQAWNFIMVHFVELSKGEELQALEAEELICLIKDDSIHAPDEEYICETAYRYSVDFILGKTKDIDRLEGGLKQG